MLNTQQQQVVDSDRPNLVVACPGSGKTSVITAKIEALLQRHPACRIVAVTFTREAAGELESRASARLGVDVLSARCRFGTFHSLAIRMLRLNNRVGRVLTPSEQYGYVRRAAAAVPDGMTIEQARELIERHKSRLTPIDTDGLDDLEDEERDLLLKEIAVGEQYDRLLARHNAKDLYDVMRDSVQMMQAGTIRPFPADFMLVDEFQDTDAVQLEWVLCHARAGTKVTVVGDDDQSVYGWRGGLGYPGMKCFQLATDADLITLGTNYRCRSEILSMADRLIQMNRDRIAKPLAAARGPGGRVLYENFVDRIVEAQAVVEAILEDTVPHPNPGTMLQRLTVPDGSWAILARSRQLLNEVEEMLQMAGIRYYRPPRESFWCRPPQSVLLHALEAIESSRAQALDHVLNHLFSVRFGRKRGAGLIESIHAGLSPSLRELGSGTSLALDALDAEELELLNSFSDFLMAWRRQLASGRHGLVIRAVGEWFKGVEPGESVEAAIDGAVRTLEKLRGTLLERCQAIHNAVRDSERKPEGVQLQTMHGSKGLEFNKVWVVGVNDDVIPARKSYDQDEERRLLYVAMTRAKDWLCLTSTGPKRKASRFLFEAGAAREDLPI